MKINIFLIFIIIIILVIIIFKLKNIEKFDNIQLGINDNTGYNENNVGLLTPNYINCEGEWSSCVNTTMNNCQSIYNINNENYIGSACKHNNGDIKDCIPDLCSNVLNYTYNGIVYNIMREKTLIHYKRSDINDNPDIQEKIEYIEGSGSELWNSDEDGDDPKIQLQKLEHIMDKYSNNSEYIGLIKDDTLDGIPKFYPIILDIDSEVEIIDSPRNTLYIKRNINCRGRWEKCKFNEDTQQSERKYVIKYSGLGSGNSCPEINNQTEICAEWGSCSIENISDDNETYNIKRWKYILPECNNINQNCLNSNKKNKHKEWTKDGCIQDNNCGVSWSDCISSGGVEVKKATISPPATGNGLCAYEDGKWYHNKRIFNSSGEIEELNCNPANGINNCICDEEDFPKPCEKKYNIYWGSGTWNGIKRDLNNKIMRDDNGIPIPKNKVEYNEPGDCWLHVYDYKKANNKYYERNKNFEICPLDDYILQDSSTNTNSYVNVGSMVRGNSIDIGYGIDKLSLNNDNIGYKFPYINNLNGWGEVCKSVNILTQDCVYDEITKDCGKKNSNKTGTYVEIDITTPKKYNGTCEYINNGTMIEDNCTNKQTVTDVTGDAVDTLGDVTGNAVNTLGDAAGDAVDTLGDVTGGDGCCVM